MAKECFWNYIHVLSQEKDNVRARNTCRAKNKWVMITGGKGMRDSKREEKKIFKNGEKGKTGQDLKHTQATRNISCQNQ